MIVPLIFSLFLSVAIGRTGKKLQIPSTGPTAVSVVLFLFFAFATMGLIKVRPDEITKGVVLGILMYLGAALVVYLGAYLWMKKKSPLVKETAEVDGVERDEAVSNGVQRFRTFLGVRGKSIEWLYPLGLFLGFVGMQVVVLLRTGSIPFLQQAVQNIVMVAFMVFGLFFLRNLHSLLTALAVALVYAGMNFLVLSLLRPTMFLTFALEFVFVLAFIAATIWMLNLVRNPWIALCLGCFLALTAMSLVFLVHMFIENSQFVVIKNYLLNTHWLWRVLHCLVITGVVFGFYKVMKLEVD